MKMWGRVFWTLLSVVCLSACGSPYRSQVVDIPTHTWSEPVSIVWENVDTLHQYDWQFYMRCSGRKDPQSFTVRIEWLTPDSLSYGEVLQVPFEENTVAAPLMRSVQMDYRRRVRLPRLGAYRIVLTPDQPIHGVKAVGMQSVASAEN